MKAPPYPQNRPDSALPRSPQPHQAPWGRVSEACGWANLRAANLHLARRACLTHDLAARLPIRSCSRRRRPAPAHRTELRANARARAAAHAKDTSSDGSRSCASAAATRQPGPFRLQSPAGRRQEHVERAFRTIWARSRVQRKIVNSGAPYYNLTRAGGLCSAGGVVHAWVRQIVTFGRYGFPACP